MSKKRFKSKSILTGGATFLTGTVLSSSFASADWNFSLGKDDSKGVYYIVSDSKKYEYSSVWEFIKALISKIFSSSQEKENVLDSFGSASGKLVTPENQKQDAVSRYEAIKEILRGMGKKGSLEHERKLDDGGYLYRFVTGALQKNNTEVRRTYSIFNVAEVKINEEQMIVDYSKSGLDKKVVINFEEEASLEKALNVLENIEMHHNIVRNQVEEKLFYEERKRKNNLVFTFDEKEGIKISPRGGKVIKVKNGDYIEKIVLSNDYCSVNVHYSNKETKKYDLTDLDAARELNGILEKVKVKEEEENIENYNVCAKVKEQIIELNREFAFDASETPIFDEMERLGVNTFTREQGENFIRKSDKSLTFKFCTTDLFKSYIAQGGVYFYLADVTIGPDKLVVDYSPSGLNRVVVVNFNDKDALEKATTVLKKIREHNEVLKYLDSDFYYKGVIRSYKKGEEKKVKFSADVGETWKICNLESCTIKDATMNNYSKFTLNYTNGKSVSYDLTEPKDANELMKILKNSYFESVEKQENKKEQEREIDSEDYVED